MIALSIIFIYVTYKRTFWFASSKHVLFISIRFGQTAILFKQLLRKSGKYISAFKFSSSWYKSQPFYFLYRKNQLIFFHEIKYICLEEKDEICYRVLFSNYLLRYDVPTVSFQTFFFLWAFKIVVDSWKFTELLLYVLWDDWSIFMISASNEQIQQELEYTLLNLIVTAGEFKKYNLDVRTF